MKTLFPFILLFIFCSSGFGQGLEFGISINGGVSKISNTSKVNEMRGLKESVFKETGGVGFFLNKRLNNKWSLVTGLSLKKVKSKATYQEDHVTEVDINTEDHFAYLIQSYERQMNFESHFFTVPFLVQFGEKRIKLNAGMNLLVHYYSFEKYKETNHVSASFSGPPSFPAPIDGSEISNIGIDDNPNFSRFIPTLQMGVGYMVDEKVEVSLNANHSSFDILKEEDRRERFNFTLLELNFGVKYFIGKNTKN